MAVYLFIFFLSSLFTYIAQRTIRQKSLFTLFSCLAILFPSLLAGFRDPGIGTDTLVYVNYIWDKIVWLPDLSSFIHELKNGGFVDIELFYLCLNWLTSKFTTDFHGIYFSANFVMMYFVYRTAYDNRKQCDMWFSIAIFLLLYYNASLNMVRQSIALALSMYANKYIEQMQWKKLIVWIIIVVLTHNTGIFFILLLIIKQIFKLKSERLKKVIKVTFSFAILLSLSSIDYFLTVFVNLGLLPTKFLMYLSNESGSIFLKSTFIFNVIILYIIYLVNRKNDTRISIKEKLNFYTYSKFIGVILLLSSIVSKWAFRISLYLNYIVDCIYLPRVLYTIKKRYNKSLYNFSVFFILILALTYWYWTIIINNGNETFPYKSKILGI